MATILAGSGQFFPDFRRFVVMASRKLGLTKPPNCPVDGDHLNETVVEAVLSLRIDDLEPRLTRSGYDVRSLAEQFDAKPAEIRRLLRGDLDPARSRELMDEMRAAGLPT
jgi:hypothetical protein